MTGNPRREVDDRLADWVDGRMSDKERERFVAELRVNAQLRQDLEQYERTVGVVRAALRAPAPSAGVADRVMAAIAAGGASPATRRAGGSTRARLWWSAAAAAALLGTAVIIDRSGPPQPTSRDTAAVEAPREADDAAEKNDGKKLAAGAESKAPVHGDKSAVERADGLNADSLRKVEEQVPQAKPDQPKSELVGTPEPTPTPSRDAARSDRFGFARAGERTVAPAAPAPPPPVSVEPQLAGGARSPGAPATGTPRTQGYAPAGVAQPPAGPAAAGARGPTTGGPTGPTTGNPAAGNPPAGDPTSTNLLSELEAQLKDREQPEGRKQSADERAASSDEARRDAPASLIVIEGVVVASRSSETKTAESTDKSKDVAKERGAHRGAPPTGGGGAGAGEAGKAKNDEATGADDFYLGSRSTLDAAALAARIDAFLADAAAPATAAAAIVLPTERGELRLSPLVEEATKKPAAPPELTPPDTKPADAKPAGTDKERNEKLTTEPVVERTWLVEGASADVEVLLARLGRFAQQHKLTRHAGETTAPASPRGDVAGAPPPQSTSSTSGRAAVADAGSMRRVVLRFRLRPR